MHVGLGSNMGANSSIKVAPFGRRTPRERGAAYLDRYASEMKRHFAIPLFACVLSAICMVPSTSFASQCQMQLEEALQIVRRAPFGESIDDPQRNVSGTFYESVPRERIFGWNDPNQVKYVAKMIAVLKGKQVWVIDAIVVPAKGVRGWNLQFFVDACDKRVLDASSK